MAADGGREIAVRRRKERLGSGYATTVACRWRGDPDDHQVERAGDQFGDNQRDTRDRPPPMWLHETPPYAL